MYITKMKLMILVLSAVVTGCAAVGVLPTTDPQTKIQDAYEMMNQGLSLRAIQFATEALSIY